MIPRNRHSIDVKPEESRMFSRLPRSFFWSLLAVFLILCSVHAIQTQTVWHDAFSVTRLGIHGLVLTVIVVPVMLGYALGWKLHWNIFISMACAIGFFFACRFLGGSSQVIEPLGQIFIRLLKMVIVPLVMSSIIVGVAGVGNPRNLGRLGIKTMAYYAMTSLFAIIIGLMLSNLIRPGEGVVIAGGEAYSEDSLEKPGSLFEVMIRMIPINPVDAAANTDMLGMIFFSIVFGFALTQVEARHRDVVLPVIDGIFSTMMKLTELVIGLAPIGVFGLIIAALNNTSFDFFKAVGMYMVTIVVGLSLHLLIVLPTVYFIITRKNPKRQFLHMASAMATAFSTSSSSATLPVTMKCVERNAGVSNKISSFVLPLGATINMDGTALYECAGVLFIAQVLGVDLSFAQQVIVVITALLASVGAAGIPSAGLVMIFIVLEAVGLQGDAVALIVGTMLAVDRPLDMMRTMTNVFSDSVGTVVIAHSEGELSPVD